MPALALLGKLIGGLVIVVVATMVFAALSLHAFVTIVGEHLARMFH